MVLNETVMVVVSDLRQIALAKMIASADMAASFEMTLDASVKRASDPSSDEAYQILRDHRPTGEPFFDRALLSIQQIATEHKVEHMRQEVQSEVLKLKEDVAVIQGVIAKLGGSEEIDLDEHAGRCTDFVKKAESIFDRLCSADTGRLIRGSQQDLSDVQQEFGLVIRPLVPDFAKRFNELLEVLLLSLVDNNDDGNPKDIRKNCAELQGALDDARHLLVDQWTMLVELFVEQVVVADLKAPGRLLIPPTTVLPWAKAASEVVSTVAAFWASLPTWNGSGFPVNGMLVGDSDRLAGAARDEQPNMLRQSFQGCLEFVRCSGWHEGCAEAVARGLAFSDAPINVGASIHLVPKLCL